MNTGKELIIKMLDLLVEMADHCSKLEKPKDSSKCKCANCALNWDFNLGNHGCFLVETIDNNEKFMEDLISTCKYHDIEYISKTNKIASIFVTNNEEDEDEE